MAISMDRDKRFNIADRITAIGLWITVGLMVMKLLAGYFGKSEAVFADGVESACDFVAIISTMIALKIGRKPFDDTHPYGHGKAECIAAIIVSLVILTTGGGILYKTVITLMESNYTKPHMIAVVAALATIIIKEILYHYTLRVSKQIESPAVEAIAKDHHKDALTSIATVIGVGGAYFGAVIMDPLAAGLTAFFIFYIGWETISKATHDLMDGQLPKDILSAITDITAGVPGVEQVHEIRGRRSGQYLIFDLKLEMDPNITVKQSHEIVTIVKSLIFDKFANIGDVTIHVNPHEEEHEDLIRL
jgi:cation diffusion facilitator family transporter